jgi:hypothetical protein
MALLATARSSILDPRSSILDPRSSILDPRSSIFDPRPSILDNYVTARLKIFLALPHNSLAHFIKSKIESGLP